MPSGCDQHGRMIQIMKTPLLDGLFYKDGNSGVGSQTNPIQVSLSEIAFQLARIADMMEGLRESTNPLNVWQEPDDDSVPRVSYSDEDQEIIEHKLQQLGREYKPSTLKK